MSDFGSSQGSCQQQQVTGGSGSGGGVSYSSSASVFYSTSASYSASMSSSNSDPQGRSQSHTQTYSETMTSNDRDGTSIRRVAEQTGRPTLIEETYIPSRPAGRGIELDGDGRQGGASGGRIEDVTNDDDQDQAARDREYEERIEDEYAKREGGA
ncbi:uncharacterized protein Z519_07783 [Cladophialophora bantiana CBS 173.52]|uniref:Uncharacterized protein n=1 Tax=Cladophialophora bantiana (strain ATCC 10958 / CBS 173.52 / CDC B-1940 / NIH 8579) TaxID=1442370 RepID=A0A0D2HEW1_CLAB1|nr:uncharacterized protein Z519_07783 [Cladophialophora bantiana CBS 173.52]KIW91813.1 hypothetical protein Z519_07783 [Cladophialophora bantiana CBS 173.52]